jgi:FKBP-type peptidyl-prolyl cis-trans isomerase FkpA
MKHPSTMKKIRLSVLSLIILLGSCSKGPECAYTTTDAVATANEIASLQMYIDTNNITAVQHPSGVFYTLHNGGSGNSPSVCSNIRVNYTGRLLGGNIFDSTQPGAATEFVLGQLVQGWQRVLPIVKAGGSITLYIPPSLGYGSLPVYNNNQQVVIPPNSYLQFDIDLLDVQ